MIQLPDDASHEATHEAVEEAKAYARFRGCRHLFFEPVCEAIGVHHSVSRMHLKAVIDGKEETLLIGPRIIHSERKPEPMTIDFNKPVQRLDGKAVRILSERLKDEDYPVIGIYTNDDGTERLETYTLCGKSYKYDDIDDPANLVNSPSYEYKLVYKDGAVAPIGWRSSDAEWFSSKEDFAGHDTDLRLGWLKREAGNNLSTVFEPI